MATPRYAAFPLRDLGLTARLAYYSEDNAAVWPDDAEKLMEVSVDFGKLAETMAHGRKQLPPMEHAERQRFLDERTRTRQAAETASRRAASSSHAASAAVLP